MLYIHTLEVEGETLKHLCYLVVEQRETSKSVSGRGEAYPSLLNDNRDVEVFRYGDTLYI